MITVTSAQLNIWIATLIWPLTRILGLIAVAPLFGNSAVPLQVKVGLSILIALIVAPMVPALSAQDPMSLTGLLILAQQLVIGLAMGFAMRMVFAAVEMAGELTGLTMGLGFATFFDPQSQGRSSAISQFLALLMTLIFLSVNGHLMLLSALVESFTTLPISAAPFGSGGLNQLVMRGSGIFSAGLQIALPIIAALLITNLALGILTRAAPQLNLFGIGFPITLTVGFVLIGLALPYMTTPIERLLQEGIELVRSMPGASVAPPLRQ
ncbi:flagellar biosynthetic protein FliR [Undibacterium arcticum]|uniref:Flagellar biosynthetic protein FliR n=1 Tax=Undibacterium arcticum TaxID=1762892 RepID=A0ABV7F3E0_9BURK